MKDGDHGFTTFPRHLGSRSGALGRPLPRLQLRTGGFVNGRFDELCGRVAVDEDGVIHTEGATAATAATVDTGVSDRDRRLRILDFLDVTAHPQVGQAPDGNVSLRGTLNLHGLILG
jgi:polyisoprenoid-binding protein YceI